MINILFCATPEEKKFVFRIPRSDVKLIHVVEQLFFIIRKICFSDTFKTDEVVDIRCRLSRAFYNEGLEYLFENDVSKEKGCIIASRRIECI